MADVRFSRAEAEGGQLPRVCLRCGAPATEDVAKKFSTDDAHLPAPFGPEIGAAGCLLFPLWALAALAKLASWATARTMTVRAPLCHKHAHGWSIASSLVPRSIAEDGITLAGVSEEFAALWAARRPVGPAVAEGPVKVRCRGCQALNEEAARFCHRCGAVI
jgi:hypothetical protein